MYQGYRIKIGNDRIPDTMIVRGSYSYAKTTRTIDRWTDANSVEHEVLAQQKKVNISFMIRPHNSSEHLQIANIFKNAGNVIIEYYDEEADAYLSGLFKMSNIVFKHRNIIGSNILYDAFTVQLTEY